MAIPHASIARLSSLMMLLDPDPAGEITASLSRDTRGIGNVVRRLNLHCSVAAIPVSSGQCGRGMRSAEVLGAAPKCGQRVKKRVVRTGVHCGGGAGPKSVHQKAKIGVAKGLVKG